MQLIILIIYFNFFFYLYNLLIYECIHLLFVYLFAIPKRTNGAIRMLEKLIVFRITNLFEF